MKQLSKLAVLFGLAVAAMVLPISTVRAQVAPFQYAMPGAPFGLSGSSETQYFGEAPDEDGFRKGFSFRSSSTPVSEFGGGLARSGFGAPGLNLTGLTAEGAQYGYSFKGVGDMPITLFGSVNTLRSNPDVFTSLVTPGFATSNTLATSVQAGVEFKPKSNFSLSLSAGFTQPSAPVDTDLRSQLLSGQQPMFLGGRR